MELNLKSPLKKLEKNDQKVGAQVDRPAQIIINETSCHKDTKQLTQLKVYI